MIKEDFARAVERAQNMTGRAFLDAVLAERADLKAQVENGTFRPLFPGLGYSAYTVIVGDEVFKTAQYYEWHGIKPKDFILGIERERGLLKYLESTSLPVPKLTYVGRELAFFGMTRLDGKVLGKSDVRGLPEKDKQRLAKDIACFCADLAKAVPEDDAVKMQLDVSPAEIMFDPQQLRADMDRPQARSLFGDKYDLFKQAVDRYAYYREKNPATAKKILMHCDLKEGNMLWDPETKRLAGVIDFGLSHLTVAESGFKKLYEKYPSDFADMVLEEYAALQSVQITREHVQTWTCAEYVAYALNSLKDGQNTGYRRGYNDYVKAPLRLSPTAPAQKKPRRRIFGF